MITTYVYYECGLSVVYNIISVKCGLSVVYNIISVKCGLSVVYNIISVQTIDQASAPIMRSIMLSGMWVNGLFRDSSRKLYRYNVLYNICDLCVHTTRSTLSVEYNMSVRLVLRDSNREWNNQQQTVKKNKVTDPVK